MNSATSQFFIVQQDAPHLDGQYAAFGRVTEGMDVVDRIASVRTGYVEAQGMDDVPVDPIVIDTIVIGDGEKPAKSKSSKSTPDPKAEPKSSASPAPRQLTPENSDSDDLEDEDDDDDEKLEIARGDLSDLL